MAKASKVNVAPKAVSSSGAVGMSCQLSEAREAELKKKIREAVEYYERTFSVVLSPSEIHEILKSAIDRDKARLFLQKVGNISEADILWYAEQNGVGYASGQKAKSNESSDAGEGESSVFE